MGDFDIGHAEAPHVGHRDVRHDPVAVAAEHRDALAGLDGGGQSLHGSVAPYADLDLPADRRFAHQARQLILAFDGLAVVLQHHVAFLQAGLGRGAVLIHPGHFGAAHVLQLQGGGALGIDVLHADSQVGGFIRNGRGHSRPGSRTTRALRERAGQRHAGRQQSCADCQIHFHGEPLWLTLYEYGSAHARDLQQRTAAVQGAFRDDAGSLPPDRHRGKVGNDAPQCIRHAVLGLDRYT